MRITPSPNSRSDRVDYFGNSLTLFTIQEPHKELTVEARSEVQIDDQPKGSAEQLTSWEEAVKVLHTDHSPETLAA